MPPLSFAGLHLSDRVQHPLRVVHRIERSRANGEPYVILTLGNSSGEIDTEPIWSNQLDAGWADGAEPGAVVEAVGQVVRYAANGAAKRQLKLTAPLRLLTRHGLQLEEFLPAIADDIAGLWARLDHFRLEIGSATLKHVLALFFDHEPFRRRFERMPASLGGHHGKLGGLLLHVFEVTHIARGAARVMRANTDLTVAGALLHDIGKVEAYDIDWIGFTRTPRGHLLEHVVLGCLMLERALAAAGEPICSERQLLDLQHLILAHHGTLGFGSPVRPLTLEAELLHWADETSANGNNIRDCLADSDAFGDGEEFAQRARLWRVDRRSLWKRTHSW
jgi:3'-5' exoribonuclease